MCMWSIELLFSFFPSVKILNNCNNKKNIKMSDVVEQKIECSSLQKKNHIKSKTEVKSFTMVPKTDKFFKQKKRKCCAKNLLIKTELSQK